MLRCCCSDLTFANVGDDPPGGGSSGVGLHGFTAREQQAGVPPYSVDAGLLSRPALSPGALRLRAAVKVILTTKTMMERSTSIWAETMTRAVSVLGVMSPKPTVENTMIVK